MRLSWVIPDLGLVVSVITLAYCLFMFGGTTKLFRDSDTGWHIRSGEAILETGKLLRTDPYSFSRAGQPWFQWEWGADALTGAAHGFNGLRGVALMFGVAIAACTWLWFRLHWASGGNFFLACLMASPMLSTANLHWLARPHVLSWVLLLVWVLYCSNESRTSGRLGWPRGLGIALFTAIWANLHASFFFVPALASLFAASHLIRPLVWDLDKTGELRRARWFLAAALWAAAGSLLNPYGIALHRHVFDYLRNTELLARVGEFQSFRC